jgi:hypothetical protein
LEEIEEASFAKSGDRFMGIIQARSLLLVLVVVCVCDMEVVSDRVGETTGGFFLSEISAREEDMEAVGIEISSIGVELEEK